MEPIWLGAGLYTPEIRSLVETLNFNNYQVWPNTFVHIVYKFSFTEVIVKRGIVEFH